MDGLFDANNNSALWFTKPVTIAVHAGKMDNGCIMIKVQHNTANICRVLKMPTICESNRLQAYQQLGVKYRILKVM